MSPTKFSKETIRFILEQLSSNFNNLALVTFLFLLQHGSQLTAGSMLLREKYFTSRLSFSSNQLFNYGYFLCLNLHAITSSKWSRAWETGLMVSEVARRK
ncbi:hypothetical protein CDAR_165121 [Caerostris darwini]|uniref:Uncharacterized protein n=1 Tax=Caerostris darwini TaxID=1538125 RepID=A0AAV4NYC9_9ARAC|nr:hypothetical protein CDAR_165121 [Caerostris darwini]